MKKNFKKFNIVIMVFTLVFLTTLYGAKEVNAFTNGEGDAFVLNGQYNIANATHTVNGYTYDEELGEINPFGIDIDLVFYDENGFVDTQSPQQATYFAGEVIYANIVVTNNGEEDYSITSQSVSVFEGMNILNYDSNKYASFYLSGAEYVTSSEVVVAPGDFYSLSVIFEIDKSFSQDDLTINYMTEGNTPNGFAPMSSVVSIYAVKAATYVDSSKTMKEIGNGNGILEVGETLEFTIDIENNSGGDVYDFVLYDTLLGDVQKGLVQGATLVGEPVVEEVRDYVNPIVVMGHDDSTQIMSSVVDGKITIDQIEAGASVVGSTPREALGDKIQVKYSIKLDESFDFTKLNLVNEIYEEGATPSGSCNEITVVTPNAVADFGGEGKLCTVIPVASVDPVDPIDPVEPVVPETPSETLPSTGLNSNYLLAGVLSLLVFAIRNKML